MSSTYELPFVAEDYVHRIGRTARAGNQGHAISLVCVDEKNLLADIEKLLQTNIRKEVVDGFEPDPRIKAEAISRGRGGQQRPQNKRGGGQQKKRGGQPNSRRSGAAQEAGWRTSPIFGAATTRKLTFQLSKASYISPSMGKWANIQSSIRCMNDACRLRRKNDVLGKPDRVTFFVEFEFPGIGLDEIGCDFGTNGRV